MMPGNAGLKSGALCATLMMLSSPVSAVRAEALSDMAADASQGPVGYGDIIVTATRREESLQKVPLSVSAMSANVLAARSIFAITDIAVGQVPGVIFQPFGGAVSVAEISIRGVSTNDATQGTREIPVPIYIDGVYQGRAQGGGLQLIDPERIEVLRGPQGTLFGRNAEGGAIQYIARKPSGKFGVDITGSLGNYDYRRVRGTLDLPDYHGFKVLLSGLYSEQAGFTKNRGTNTLATGSVSGVERQQADFALRENKGVRAAVRWDGVDSLVVDYAFDWSRGADSQSYSTYSGPPIPGVDAPTSSVPDQSSRAFYNAPFISHVSGHMLTAAYEANDNVTLKSISSYRKVRRVGYSNLGPVINLAPAFGLSDDPSDAIYYVGDENLRQHQYSQEVQLLGTWDHFQLTTGAVYYTETVQQAGRNAFFTGPGLANFGFPDFRPGARAVQRSHSKSLGLFAQAAYTPPILDEKLDLTAGLRYADDKKRTVRTLGPGDAFGVTEIPLNQRANVGEKRVDPAFTIKYKFSELANIYLRYAQAYRGGGVSIRSASFLPYDSEVTKSFEIGMKFQDASRRLTANAAVYQNKVYNPQIDFIESPILTQTTTTINAPMVRRIRGFELETSYRTPVPGLQLSVSYAYMSMKQPPFINPSGAPAGLVYAVKLFAPRHSGSVNVDYTKNVGMGDLVFHVDYSHSSKFFVGGEVNSVGYVSPTDPLIVRQLNGRVTLEKLAVGDSNLSVSLWVKNLLDRSDVGFAYSAPGDPVHSYNYLVDPRTYGVDVRFRF